MLKARIFWDQQKFDYAEKILKKASGLYKDNECWNMNYGHVLFVQGKYEEAAEYYNLCLQRKQDDVIFLIRITFRFCPCRRVFWPTYVSAIFY
jgi:tetratricopeptide (TPR) repeat protein